MHTTTHSRTHPTPSSTNQPHHTPTDALHEKLEDIAWIDEQPWRESLVVTSGQPTQVDDVDDDLQRELAFYNQVGAGW